MKKHFTSSVVYKRKFSSARDCVRSMVLTPWEVNSSSDKMKTSCYFEVSGAKP